MNNKNNNSAVFSVVGIGPGSLDYLLPAAEQEIKNSDLLVGGSRHLELFSGLNKKTFVLDGRISEFADFIRSNKEKHKIAVLVSGDPGYYSLLGLVRKNFDPSEYIVIPGISSFQLAFARVKLEWKDAQLLSLHGRPLTILDKYISEDEGTGGTLALLTDKNNTPYKISGYLISKGCRDRKVFIAENLSYPDEKITETTLKNVKEKDVYNLCVMIILK
jgi:precorrin-6y C5,15-methyltransferase (decarboxylating) CbiE subunit